MMRHETSGAERHSPLSVSAEAAANLLTNSALDPEAKIPEYKFAAVRIDVVAAGPPDDKRLSGSSTLS